MAHLISTSTDGGQHWGTAFDHSQQNPRVLEATAPCTTQWNCHRSHKTVMTLLALLTFISTNGGISWSNTVTVAKITGSVLPTAEMGWFW